MIIINIGVDNVNTVLQVYDQIRIQRSSTENGTFVEVVGLGPVDLISNTTSYTITDPNGLSTDWYRSQYYSSSTLSESAWSSPVLGESGDIYYDPLYPPELSLNTSEKLVINRIRTLIGDPVNLNREYGESAETYLHNDGKVFELPEKGWPASITMDGVQYSDTNNPSINGYKYLKFSNYVDTPVITHSGTRLIYDGIDVWYYTFRWSDREILYAYNNTPPPAGLTMETANGEVYMLACAYDLLTSEAWESISEDGVKVTSDKDSYDSSPGLSLRKDMLDKLKKRLDELIKTMVLSGISGVLLD